MQRCIIQRWQTFRLNWMARYSRHNSLTLHSGSRRVDTLARTTLAYSSPASVLQVFRANARRDARR